MIGKSYFNMKHTFYLVSFFTHYINYCNEILKLIILRSRNNFHCGRYFKTNINGVSVQYCGWTIIGWLFLSKRKGWIIEIPTINYDWGSWCLFPDENIQTFILIRILNLWLEERDVGALPLRDPAVALLL